ncbi:hypothetical protein A2U01_0047865 [Trifolium medium]|uniref:Uncharacterized protein n=1 Tax=Trifolium medium TaxID=97028 RepID=A0A392QQZ0_9FABA|nr:hypothetical protein [Trifolium medium]
MHCATQRVTLSRSPTPLLVMPLLIAGNPGSAAPDLPQFALPPPTAETQGWESLC